MKVTLFYTTGLLKLVAFVFFVTACHPTSVQNTPTASTVEATISTSSPSSIQPESTPPATDEPLAAKVNGQGITLAEFETELSLFQQATGLEPTEEDRLRVLNNLIDQALLEQAAEEKGFLVDDSTLQTRLDSLTTNLGGAAALAQWIDNHGYTEQTFRQSLARAVAAAWMRDQITAAVPDTAEQVHARQILVYGSQAAQEIFAQLEAGNDFGNLANQYDPLTGGELGWFPRGYLPDPELEAAAFELQPGEYSPVIQTVAGFHILQVIERDLQHPLTPQALLMLQSKAVQDWIAAQRQQSDIQILIS